MKRGKSQQKKPTRKSKTLIRTATLLQGRFRRDDLENEFSFSPYVLQLMVTVGA